MRVGITSSISNKDSYPKYAFFVYDEAQDIILIDLEDKALPQEDCSDEYGEDVTDC